MDPVGHIPSPRAEVITKVFVNCLLRTKLGEAQLGKRNQYRYYESKVVDYEKKKQEKIAVIRQEIERKEAETLESTRFRKKSHSPRTFAAMDFLTRLEIHQKQREKDMQALIEQVNKEREEKEGVHLTFMPKINRDYKSPSPPRLRTYKSEKSLSPEKKYRSLNDDSTIAKLNQSEIYEVIHGLFGIK